MTTFLPNRIEPLPMSCEVYIPLEGDEMFCLTQLANLPIPNCLIKIGDFEICDGRDMIVWSELVNMVELSDWYEPFICSCGYNSGCGDKHIKVNFHEKLIYFTVYAKEIEYQILSVTYANFMETIHSLFEKALAVIQTKLVKDYEGELVCECNLVHDGLYEEVDFIYAYNRFHRLYKSYKEFTTYEKYKNYRFSGQGYDRWLPNELPLELREETELEREFREFEERERAKEKKLKEEQEHRRLDYLTKFGCEGFSLLEEYIRRNKPSFPDTAQVIWEGEKVTEFDYCDAEEKLTHRRVKLEAVLKYDELFYLRGFCELRQDERIFRYDRTSLTDTDLDEIIDQT